MARIDDMLGALMALHPKRIDLSLGRIEQLLERLGRPQRTRVPVASESEAPFPGFLADGR